MFSIARPLHPRHARMYQAKRTSPLGRTCPIMNDASQWHVGYTNCMWHFDCDFGPVLSLSAMPQTAQRLPTPMHCSCLASDLVPLPLCVEQNSRRLRKYHYHSTLDSVKGCLPYLRPLIWVDVPFQKTKMRIRICQSFEVADLSVCISVNIDETRVLF